MSQSTKTDRIARISKLMGMTGSAHDGEALNALRLAQRIASEAGLSLMEAIQQSVITNLDAKRIAAIETDAFQRGYDKGKTDKTPSSFPPWLVMAEQCSQYPLACSKKEIEFIDDIIARQSRIPHYSLSEKQQKWLEAIFIRVAPTDAGC